MSKTRKKIVLFIGIMLMAFCCALAIEFNGTESMDSLYSPFLEFKESERNVFKVDLSFDLKGSTLVIPPDATIEFNGGEIINGTIKGDSTKLVVSDTPVFDNVKIEGSWKIQDIKTDFFKSTDENTASNLVALCSPLQYNIITINRDLFIPIKPWKSYFNIPSNTDVILNADLYTLPTEDKGGYCMQADGENININGNGHYLFGTIGNPEQKECFQWLHGLNISRNSINVKVKNLNSWYFCGDGFYNAGSNIEFKNINAKFNGRQGLSITNGRNILVQSSSFTYTGYYRICTSGGPGAGIDIEPNKGDTVNDVRIENCTIIDNYRDKHGFVNDLEVFNAKNANVKVLNSKIGGLMFGSCSGVDFNGCFNIKTVVGINTDIENITLPYMVKPHLSKNAVGNIKLIEK